MTRAQRQVDNIRDCGDNDSSTFFQEPGGDRIRIRLLIRTIEYNLRDCIFTTSVSAFHCDIMSFLHSSIPTRTCVDVSSLVRLIVL